MAKYGLFLKGGNEAINIFESNSDSLRYKVDSSKIARNYFRIIKKLSEDKFDKLFDVKRI